ncbi:MAG TPA: IPT/TIG domain-containing protein [Pyrinomonadaceae bacterium]|jgi:hypothetical protein|nr:IPT/TIG domain-containing protein [Pyrinomonadaceae bacterium]
MNLFEGKTSTERNKIIAAGVLGLVALVALYLAFGRSMFSSSTTTVKVTTSPTPRPPSAPNGGSATVAMPTVTEQDFVYQTTPIDYRPGSSYAPDPGRNIFAFYEPPPPCPPSICPPTPKPTPTPIPPTPAPTPPVLVTFMNPPSTYTGTRGFRLEVNGDKFTSDMHIYYNQVQLPTTFVNAQKLVTELPANMVAQEGPAQIIVQNADGKLYSNAATFTVMAPPRPTVTYIGMISRARHNNDTAYFLQSGSDKPFGARLNDVVQSRFRVIDISPAEVVFQDVELPFKHRVQITRAGSGASTGAGSPAGGFPSNGFPNSFPQQFNPTINSPCVPGIPCNLPQYITPQVPQKQPDEKKQDVDDDDDGPPE